MKKTALIMLLALLCTLCTWADNYKILFLNSPTVKIGNKTCKVGDVFSEAETIHWSKKGQALRAQNVASKEIRMFVEEEFKKLGATTAKDYFLRTNRLSTRGDMDLTELKTYLSREFYLLDSLQVDVAEGTDSLHYYLLSYVHDGQQVQHKLAGDDDTFVVTRSLFPADKASEFVLTIVYVNEKKGRQQQLTDSMRLQLLPLELAD